MGDAERKMEEADIVEWIDDDGRTRTDGRTTHAQCTREERGETGARAADYAETESIGGNGKP